jgi:hypothetical protein
VNVTHHSTLDAVHCVQEHLDALVDHLGTAMAVCELFNCQPRRLFELTFDEQFGVWLLRPAS